MSTLPWICIGDFNKILRPKEQHGPNERDSTQIEAFREVVDVCGIAYLGYRGLNWTWEKNVSGGHFCRVRLDRAMASPCWSALFPFATVEHLIAAKSDHNPILLETELVDSSARAKQKKQFRYECTWEREPSFGEVVAEAWQTVGRAQSVSALTQELAMVARRLQSWGRTTFGSVRTELRSLRLSLQTMRSPPDRTGPTSEEEAIEARMVELSLQEEIMWR
ncbi:hypothetical protein D1007_40398 [Hordeum vulgare]|nr:hypothetical protein D1007_40398 [Hordeum vulgare]